MITRCADTGRVPPARGVAVSAAALPAGLRSFQAGRTDYTRIFIFIVTIFTVITAGLLIIAVVLTAVPTVVSKAVACASRKRILSTHKIISFVDFGEATKSCKFHP